MEKRGLLVKNFLSRGWLARKISYNIMFELDPYAVNIMVDGGKPGV